MRFSTSLSLPHQRRASVTSEEELGTGERRFRRGASASLRFRRRVAIISPILMALMLVGNIPATAAATVTSTIPVGANPHGVAFSPDGSTAYVTGNQGVSVISVPSGTVTSTIPVSSEGLAVTPDGSTAYVTNFSSNTVSVIAVASGTVTSTIPVGSSPRGVAFTPDGSTAYVTNFSSDTVSVIAVASGTVDSTIPVGTKPLGVAVSPDGSRAYVTSPSSNTVSVIAVASGTVTSTIQVVGRPAGVAFSPDGSRAYVTNNGSNTVSVIGVASGTVTSTITVGSAPWGIAVSPDGSTAYVANQFSNTVSVIAVASGTVTSTIPVGDSPENVAVSPDGSTAYVTNEISNTVSVITVNPAPPVFTAAKPPTTATVGAAYTYTFTATGNPASHFTVSSGSLPAGLGLNTTTGLLSGTPNTAGQATFTVNATNGVSPDAVTDSITITVNPAQAAPVFTAATPPTKMSTRTFSTYTFAATGSPAPTFRVSSGALPAGLRLNTTTGVLSGTPTTAGQATFTVTATNGVSPDAVTSGITIKVNKAPAR